jgi:hypothetical protein
VKLVDISLALREERRPSVFENMVLRNIFGPKKDEITGEWGSLHNEELYDLRSPSTIRVINSRKMRRAGHLAHMEARRSAYRQWWGGQRERHDLKDPGVDGRIILQWIF